jgi:hypothetical protein
VQLLIAHNYYKLVRKMPSKPDRCWVPSRKRQQDQCDHCKEIVAKHRRTDSQTDSHYFSTLPCHKSAKWLRDHPGADHAYEAQAEIVPVLDKATPRHVPRIFDPVNTERVKQKLASMHKVFLMNDRGHSGNEGHLIAQLAGFSKETNRPEIFTVENGVVGKTGEETALNTHKIEQQLDFKCSGSMTDSAASAIGTQSEAMKRRRIEQQKEELERLKISEEEGGGWWAQWATSEERGFEWTPWAWLSVGGCVLHVMSLTFERPYTSVFGLANLGFPSVLMLLRTIQWLQERYHSEELLLAEECGIVKFPKRRIKEAVLSRWQTLSAALRWWYEHREAYGELAGWMCDSLHPDLATKRTIYRNVSNWLLRSEKLFADCIFCLCFAEGVWDIRYFELIKLDQLSGRAGFQSHRMARSYADYISLLTSLCKGGWMIDSAFVRFVNHLKEMEDKEQVEVSKRQADKFFEVSLEYLVSHAQRWMRDLLFTSLGDDEAVAKPLAKVLLVAMSTARAQRETRQTAITISTHGKRPRITLAVIREEKEKCEAEDLEIMMVAVRAEIASFADDKVRVDAVDGSGPGREYELQTLLTNMTMFLRPDVVLSWPIATLAMQEVLGKWAILPSSDNGELLSEQDTKTLLDFVEGWCYGFPSTTQSTERAVKRCRAILRCKAKLSPAMTRAIQMLLDNEIASDKNSINKEKRAAQKDRQAQKDSEANTESEAQNESEPTGGGKKKIQSTQFRSTWFELFKRALLILARIPTDDEARGAPPVQATNTFEQRVELAQTNKTRGELCREGGLAQRESCLTSKPNDKHIPNPGNGFLGKIKAGSVRVRLEVEAELTARGISFVPRSSKSKTVTPTEYHELCRMLPRDKDGFLVGGLMSGLEQSIHDTVAEQESLEVLDAETRANDINNNNGVALALDMDGDTDMLGLASGLDDSGVLDGTEFGDLFNNAGLELGENNNNNNNNNNHNGEPPDVDMDLLMALAPGSDGGVQAGSIDFGDFFRGFESGYE